ncbi:diaminopropionate ammonia-lyase [Sneathiella limimaris]|uniref:diaminopropionate ammonia-lyase n=1 Tax=Sneathiella limimaris TaxID=1964213 RepID=UPI00146DF6F8|nr:diaminopropionate ammonia-lyase [Sneathiella limimaris]
MLKSVSLNDYFDFSLPVTHVSNQNAIKGSDISGHEKVLVGEQDRSKAFAEISSWPGYAKTPLLSLAGLAQECDVASIAYKDEAGRFGLGSFKALGGSYAVLLVIKEKLGGDISTQDILNGKYKDEIAQMTVCSATDGNHGRAVAWSAERFGCRCVIYVHERVSQGRMDAIAAYGAEVRQVPGNYDDAVREAARVSEENGWTVVSDTSYEGYVTIPRNVIKGYTVMVSEAIDQHEQEFGVAPTHIFVQGGVGALAGAVASSFWEHYGSQRPRFIVVEPDTAACLLESAKAGKPAVVKGDLDTLMAGLACGEVSLLGWEILKLAADDFMSISDAAAVSAMRLLADLKCVAGESAVAGLAGFILANHDPKLKVDLGLNKDSRLLFFGSEGATDPELYQELIGKTASEVIAAK